MADSDSSTSSSSLPSSVEDIYEVEKIIGKQTIKVKTFNNMKKLQGKYDVVSVPDFSCSSRSR